MVLDGKKQIFLVITTNIQCLFFAYFECVLHGKIVQIKKRWIVHLETNWVMNLLWTHCKLTQARVEKSHNFFSYNIPCDWY